MILKQTQSHHGISFVCAAKQKKNQAKKKMRDAWEVVDLEIPCTKLKVVMNWRCTESDGSDYNLNY